MTTIILTLIGVSLLLSAFVPELRYYYRRSRIVPACGGMNAETARKLTGLSIRYLSAKQCVIGGRQLQRKTVYFMAAIGVLFLTCVFLIITCPYELPFLLAFALGSYMWVVSSCILLSYCLRSFKIPFILSLTAALVLPVCIYGLSYFIIRFINPLNINRLL